MKQEIENMYREWKIITNDQVDLKNNQIGLLYMKKYNN